MSENEAETVLTWPAVHWIVSSRTTGLTIDQIGCLLGKDPSKEATHFSKCKMKWSMSYCPTPTWTPIRSLSGQCQVNFGPYLPFLTLNVIFDTRTRISFFACLKDADRAALKNAAPAPGSDQQKNRIRLRPKSGGSSSSSATLWVCWHNQ